MNLDEFKDQLEAAGYRTADEPLCREMNECKWYAYRKSELDARQCECNEKPWMQIVVKPFQYSINGTTHQSVEIELCGEANATWWGLKAYAIKPDEFFERIEGVERRLIAAWNALEAA